MITFILISIIHGVPATGVILIIYYLIQEFQSDQLAKKVRKVLFTLLALYVVGFSIYAWWERTYWYYFQIEDRYECKLEVIEIDSFLDAPTEFELNVKDLKSGKFSNYELGVIDGSGLIFSFAKDSNVLQIEGDEYTRAYWLIDLDKGDFISRDKSDLLSKPNFKVFAKLNGVMNWVNLDNK